MRRRFLNPFVPVTPDPGANNQILYTTTDSQPITPFISGTSESQFGSKYIQSTYEYDAEEKMYIGVMYFESDITAIGSQAFANQSTLKTIRLPQSVTHIKNEAFKECENLEEITLSEGLQIIGSRAFEDTNIKSIYLPNTLVTINDSAFDGASLEGSLFIPDSVTYLGLYSFSSTNIQEVHIGNGITTLKTHVFSYCDSLNSVSFGQNITSIDTSAFFGSFNLSQLIFNQKDIKNLFESVRVNSSNNLIKDQIKTVELNNTTTIASWAFWKFSLLEHIQINGQNINSIGSGAFSECPSLQKIDLSQQTSLKTLESSLFESDINLEEIVLPTSLVNVESAVFKNCKSMYKLVNFPKTLTHVPNSLFEGCECLQSVTLREGIVSIGEAAYKNCKWLIKINIPKSLKTINNEAFLNTNIHYIDLADVQSYLSITYVGDGCYPAFNGAKFTLNGNNLVKIVVREPIYDIPPHAFHWYDRETCTISAVEIDIRPEGERRASTYSSVSRSSSYPTLQFYFLRKIGPYAFYGCKNLHFYFACQYAEDLEMKEIGDYAFCGCSNLKYTPAGASNADLIYVYAQKIGKYAFANCGSRNIVVHAYDIADHAFEITRYSKLAITCPKVGSRAFYRDFDLNYVQVWFHQRDTQLSVDTFNQSLKYKVVCHKKAMDHYRPYFPEGTEFIKQV